MGSLARAWAWLCTGHERRPWSAASGLLGAVLCSTEWCTFTLVCGEKAPSQRGEGARGFSDWLSNDAKLWGTLMPLHETNPQCELT